MNPNDPPRAHRNESDSSDDSGYDSRDIEDAERRAYTAGRRRTEADQKRSRTLTTVLLSTILPVVVVCLLIAAVPCAICGYIFLLCTGGLR